MPKTKIIATLGPASGSKQVLSKMIRSGLDIVRLNFSHGSHEEHVKRAETVRLINKSMRRRVKIMQDLEGYRIRIGKLKKAVLLKKGSCIYLTQENVPGNEKEIHFDYEGDLKPIKSGTLIYIDDGKLVLEVKNRERNRLKARIKTSGILKENKGVNIPDARLDFEPLTKKDRDDIKIAIKYKFEYVAQSFVNKAGDIVTLKKLLKKASHEPLLYAKIESRDGLKNIDNIINEADGIIVARGDLGICVPIYKVPVIQKEIIRKCVAKKKPVVVATQMLDSMTEEPMPTRAEVSDVANAILDGANMLLLSGETAVGKFPDKTVDMMNNIICYTESYKKILPKRG